MTDAEKQRFAEQEWSIWRGPHVSQPMPPGWDPLQARLDRYGLDEASNDAALQGFAEADAVGLPWAVGRYAVGKAAFALEGELTARGVLGGGAEGAGEAQWGARLEGQAVRGGVEDARAGEGALATGARRVFGPTDWGPEVDAAYDAIRAAREDVARIADNTGFSADEIKLVKDHIFNNTHVLDDGVIARFDADPFIANAWQRLIDGTFSANDIALLRHELFELNYESMFQSTYREAHDAAIQAGYVWEWSQ